MFKLFSLQGSFRTKAALLLACLGFASGCGSGFEPGSEVKTLRVFSLQKDAPYPSPGQSVNLSLLWEDAKGGPLDDMGKPTERPIQILWAPTCTNPGNDLYYNCFPQFASRPDEFVFGDARELSTHVMQVPSDIVATHTPAAPGTPSYGIAYSFFALCAGTLALEAPKESGGLPIFCKDGEKYLNTDDFVLGYAAAYVFEDPQVKNHNPALKGLQIEGTQYLSQSEAPDSPVCIGRECVPGGKPLKQQVDCAVSPTLCFPTCADNGGDNCPDIHVHPLIDPPAERDDVSAIFYGHPDFTEQMWVSYYANGGKFSGDTRLLNDAEKGWAGDGAATLFRAPNKAGPVTLWVVVHDNRGGTDWARIQLGIQ